MKVAGTHTFNAPRQVVWPMLLDPDVLARVMPGCKQLSEVGPNEYEGALSVRVGPVQGQFSGTVRLENIQEPEGYEMHVDGKGPSGFVEGSGGLRLEDGGESTTLHYDGEVQVGGRIASVGQRLLDSSARAIIRQSLTELEKQIEFEQAPPEQKRAATKETAATPSPAGPGETEFALGVARNLLEEYVPPEARGDLLARGGAALIAFALLWLFANWWSDQIARRVVARLEERR